MKTIMLASICLFVFAFSSLARLHSPAFRDTINNLTIQSVSPNPFNDKVNILVNVSDSGSIGTTLSDIYGKKVFSQQFLLAVGINSVILTVPQLHAGNYLLEVRAGNFFQTKSLVKVARSKDP